jgi:rhodanese-related sulfurtransferase
MRFSSPRIFCVLVVAFLATWGGAVVAQEATISAPEANALASRGQLTLVDVRTPDEWRKTGVPAGAKLVDLHNRGGQAAFLEQFIAAVGGDTSFPVAVICRTGSRSTQAQKLLMANGFTHVLNIKEGVMGSEAGPGWVNRGLPVTPCPTC